MKPPFLLAIIEADLDNAIAANRKPSLTETCLVAQALRRQTEGRIKSITYAFFDGDKRYSVCGNRLATNLMDSFDAKQYATVRAQLPATLELQQTN